MPELRLVVMSATLELEALATRMPRARVLRSEGRSHPVAVEHQRPRQDERLEQQVVRALESHWLPPDPAAETALVFLPGLREIQQCRRAIAATPWGDGIDCLELHGSQPLEQQSQALAPPSPGRGKVVLASAIAESSLTIEGVSLVIDAGLARRSRFDPVTGMDGLVTVAASRASAEQRAGRAGRLRPGRCVRLWSPAEQRRRPEHDLPELLEADPLPLALQLACWGDPLGHELPWLDPPRAAALAEARELLGQLGALDGDGHLNGHGRRLVPLGLHPRLAHMLLSAGSGHQLELASELAVLLSERDPLPRSEAGSDLRLRLDWLRRQPAGHPLRRLQRQWLRQAADAGVGTATAPGAGVGEGAGVRAEAALLGEAAAAARLVAAAYPERVALARRDGGGEYLMRGGRGALLHPHDSLHGTRVLAIASADGAEQNARILLALPLAEADLRVLGEQQGHWQPAARWDSETRRVRCKETLRLGALVLDSRPWREATGPAVREALLQGLRQQGLSALPWTPALRQLQQRLNLAHEQLGAPWPDRRDEVLLEEAASWLGPQLEGCRSLVELGREQLEEALWGPLAWGRRQELERLLPPSLTVPSGRQVTLDYCSGTPVLAVKLQEMFGSAEGPKVLNGKLPVTLHLLTPAGRPAAITQDLAGFWSGSYRDVRRELRGRYPKHPWPEDGASARPTPHTKARIAREGGASCR